MILKYIILIFLLVNSCNINLKKKKELKYENQNETDFLDRIGFDGSEFLDFFENIIKLPFRLVKDLNNELNQNKSVLKLFRS